MEIYLVRHTTPEVGKGICYGQADLSLSGSFELEMQRLKNFLPKTFDIIYSSPLQRCRQMASILANEVEYDPRLMEMNFGDWEMKSWSDIDSAQLNEWMANFVNIRVPSGESMSDLMERLTSFWKQFESKEYERVAICTHAGPIRCILGMILGVTPENYFKWELDYGSVSKIKMNKRITTIQYVNRIGDQVL